MILALDAYYQDQTAHTVGLAFKHWTDAQETKVYQVQTQIPSDYISGQFYKRELPGILKLLEQIDLQSCEALIVDGYVYLDDQRKPGLGGHLYKELEGKIPVIGVAKSDFISNHHYKKEIFRGNSKHPLYISAAGISLETAARLISEMHGDFRIPTLLKKLDFLTREMPWKK